MSIAILSFDGGGMKGIVSAVVADKLERLIQTYSQNPEARIGEYFDLVAGTSTGSILTALYLTPENSHPKYSASEILDFYRKLGPSVFQKQSLYPLFGSKYISSGFEVTLKNYFGSLRISDLFKPCLITSYDTTIRKAVFFNSETGRHNPKRNPLVCEAVRASCAAPTYFPPVCLSSTPDCSSCYIDGGIIANNPSLCAIIESLKLEQCQSIHDIHLMSIGNIRSDSTYSCREVKKWGLIEWASPLFSLLLNSNEQTVDYQLNILFNILGKSNRYLRIQMHSPKKPPAMDDFSNDAIDYLLTCGDEICEKYQTELDEFAQWLVLRKNKMF